MSLSPQILGRTGGERAVAQALECLAHALQGGLEDVALLGEVRADHRRS